MCVVILRDGTVPLLYRTGLQDLVVMSTVQYSTAQDLNQKIADPTIVPVLIVTLGKSETYKETIKEKSTILPYSIHQRIHVRPIVPVLVRVYDALHEYEYAFKYTYDTCTAYDGARSGDVS